MKKTLSILIVLLVLSFVLTGNAGCSTDKKHDAWIYAKQEVRAYLKAPSTAQFCSYSPDRVTSIGEDRYEIKGYVDAQNSFGATVRSYFTVTLTLSGFGYKDAYCSFS